MGKMKILDEIKCYLEEGRLEVEEKNDTEAQWCLDRFWYSLNCSARFDRVIIASSAFVSLSRAALRLVYQWRFRTGGNWTMNWQKSSEGSIIVQTQLVLGPWLSFTWTFSHGKFSLSVQGSVWALEAQLKLTWF